MVHNYIMHKSVNMDHLLNIVIYIIIRGFCTELHNTTSHHQTLLINSGFFIAYSHKITIQYTQAIKDSS